MNREALRPGQRKALDVILARFKEDQPYTSIVLPTRYGKSDVIRLATYLLWMDGMMPCALALSVNETLRNQLGSARKWEETCRRYGIDPGDVRIRTLETAVARPSSNGELFLSVTTQLVGRNLDLFRDWVDSEFHRTGCRPLVFVDECQFKGSSNTWGHLVEELVVSGARAVLLTATAERADGDLIPGFETTTVREEDTTLWIATPGKDEQHVHVDVYADSKRVLRLKAHHETPFKDAWAEQALCDISHIPFDVDLSRVEGHDVEKEIRLSQIVDKREIRRAIGRCTRSVVVAEEGCHRLVVELRRLRRLVGDVAAIVFVGNDDDQDDPSVNKHATQIVRILGRLAPDLRCVVATSRVDGATGLVEAFAEGGVGDVLIVKQMAGLGLDVPRLKIGLDLSSVRQYAAYVQRMMRIATPYKQCMVASWICPAEILAEALFQRAVKNEGGEAITHDLEFIRDYEKLREPDEASRYAVDGIDLADFEDSVGHHAEKERWPFAEKLLNAFPLLQTQYSHAQVVSTLEFFRLDGTDGETAGDGMDHHVRDTSLEAELLFAEINEAADEVADRHFASGEFDRSEWPDLRREAFARAFQAAGVPYGTKMRKVGTVAQLRTMLASLREQLEKLEMDRQAAEAARWEFGDDERD